MFRSVTSVNKCCIDYCFKPVFGKVGKIKNLGREFKVYKCKNTKYYLDAKWQYLEQTKLSGVLQPKQH